MMTFVLYLMLCGNMSQEFFDGVQALPNPTPDDCVTVPIENTAPRDLDPVVHA